MINDNLVRKNSKIFAMLIYVFGMFLNMQKPMFGYNFSISDILILIILVIFIIQRDFVLEKTSLIFFLLLLIFNTINSVFFVIPEYIPDKSLSSFLSEIIKIGTAFLFFQVSINISLIQKEKIIYKGLVFVSFILGVFSLIVNVFSFTNDFLIDSGRYIGLLSDPNYFAVVQCCSIAFILFSKEYTTITSIILFIGIFIGIIFSASKTGMVLLILLLLMFIFKKLLFESYSLKQILKMICLFGTTAISGVILSDKIQLFIFKTTQNYPILNRVLLLFTDRQQAVSANGSTRDEVWFFAKEIIAEKPLLGIGSGNYLSVTKNMFGDSRLAHNTIFQLMAEWGILFSSVLFILILIVLFKSFKVGLTYEHFVLITVLIGSQSLSLNNSRVLWVFLGVCTAKAFRIDLKNNIKENINGYK